jgi:tetratricopeptide (TPR) repeat protein
VEVFKLKVILNKFIGRILTLVGIIIACFFLIMTIYIFFSKDSDGSRISTSITCLILTLIGIFMFIKGRSKNKKMNRLHIYNGLISDAGKTSIEDIAKIVKKPTNFVALDLQQLIMKNYIAGIYIDLNSNNIVFKKSDNEKILKINKKLEALKTFKYHDLYRNHKYKKIKYKVILEVLIYENLKKYEKAEQTLLNIIDNNKVELDLCYIHLGNIFIKMNKLIETSNCYEKALQINPENQEIRNKKDNITYKISSDFINEGKAKKAVDFLLKVYEREGERVSVSTINNISWAYNELRDYENALKFSNIGIEKDNNDYYILTNKGNALFGLNKNEEALEIYDKVIGIAPTTYPYGWFGKGISNYYLHNYYEAEVAFKKYINIKQSQDAYYYLSESLHAQHKYEEEIEFLNSIIKKSRNIAWYYNSKGYALCFQNKFHDAIECFDKTIKLDENFADAYYSKCRIFCEFNVIDGALDMFKKAVELDKKFKDVGKEDNMLDIIRSFKEYEKIINECI